MPKWPAEGCETLHRLYPDGGSRSVHTALPHRAMGTIKVVAHKRGLSTTVSVGRPKNFSNEAIVAALDATRWVAKDAAALLGCSVDTVYTGARRERRRRREEVILRKQSRAAMQQQEIAA